MWLTSNDWVRWHAASCWWEWLHRLAASSVKWTHHCLELVRSSETLILMLNLKTGPTLIRKGEYHGRTFADWRWRAINSYISLTSFVQQGSSLFLDSEVKLLTEPLESLRDNCWMPFIWLFPKLPPVGHCRLGFPLIIDYLLTNQNISRAGSGNSWYLYCGSTFRLCSHVFWARQS